MNTYTKLIEKLQLLTEEKKSKLELKPLQEIYDQLHLSKIPYIHVAGTNGKGSCVEKLSAALSQSGYRCGSFSSPHIHSFRERIKIDGEMISKEDLIQFLPPIFEKWPHLTFFETLTLLALTYFSEKKVDVAVIEVGLGGRLDATNCITPILSIITSIGLDHQHILGDTLEKIAFEKAGIIKNNVPLLCGVSAHQSCIKEIAEQKSAPYTLIEESDLTYDLENQRIARKAIELLTPHFTFDSKILKSALEKKPCCRLQKVIYKNRALYFDVAHNEPALKRLFSELNQRFKNKTKRVYFALSHGHVTPEILNLFTNFSNHLTLLDIDHTRLDKAQNISKALLDIYPIQSVEEALKAIEQENKNDLFLFCGSVYSMDAILQKIKEGISSEEAFQESPVLAP